MQPLDDPREELALLVRALRAHAEWQAATGGAGLPRASAELAKERALLLDSDTPAAAAPSSPAVSSTASSPDRAAASSGAVVSSIASDDHAAGGPDKAARLEVLAAEVSACTACRLHATRTQTVFARGTGKAGLCFIGEGPGADEDAQGYPFVGKAGQLLDRMIAAMGFSRDDVHVTNIVRCRPPDNRKPDEDEMAACIGYLQRQLEILEPEVIVALGATAVQGLLGTTEGITRLRGKWKLYKGRVAVMPTFHPAYLLRNPAAKRDVWNDLQAVLRQMGRPIPETKKP